MAAKWTRLTAVIVFAGVILLLPAGWSMAQGGGITVPDLSGLSVPEAAALLNGSGLALGVETDIGWTESSPVERNRISGQSVTPGEAVSPGTAVDVTVAREENTLLLYDDNDLTVLNQTGGTIDLAGLMFNALDGVSPAAFAATRWAATLRPDQCLQIWSEGRNGPKGVEGCQYIQNWLWTGNAAEHFWTGSNGATQFAVLQNGLPVATCEIAAGRCAFFLAVAGQEEAADFVYMAYTDDRLVIHNTSPDRWLPLGDLTLMNYAVSETGFGVGVSDPALYGTRSPVADLSRLAPGQCVLFTNSAPAIAAPPEPCTVVARLNVQPDLIFWAAEFGLQRAGGTEYRCPAASPDRLTLCIMPR